ncbi:MAG TPA: TolC family protein, partial [Alphaproteobacteria bacterium]|nr:TolC family protein [Alphaproteobacteria bacterium]
DISVDFKNLASLKPFKTDAAELERIALASRPELREEIYNRRIADNDLRLSVFETFPGFEALFGANYDSNSFLERDQWSSFSLGFTQSLMKLFTLPARMRQAKDNQALTDLRRQAMAAAIMAQVRISTTRMNQANARLGLMRQLYGVNNRLSTLADSKRIARMLTPAEELEVDMDLMATKIRAMMAFVDAQNSYGQVLASLGVDPLPDVVEDQSIPALAKLLEDRLNTLETTEFSAILTMLYEAETRAMAEAAAEIKPKRKPKINIKKEFKPLQTSLIQTETTL